MEIEKITVMLNNLTQKTAEKKIDWKLINPQAVRWIRMLGGRQITVTLQAQPRTSIGSNRQLYYILNIQSPPEAVLQVNTLTDTTYQSILEQLFNTAVNFAKESTAGIIDNLLDGID